LSAYPLSIIHDPLPLWTIGVDSIILAVMRLGRRTLTLALLVAVSCSHHSKLPKLFPVPGVTLTRSDGQPLNLADNRGYVTVYDFIFTRCGGTCPVMAGTMRQLTKRVNRSEPVRFVSVTVDPTHDTPAVLENYARQTRNDDRWLFVTGDRGAIVKLSVAGFKLAAGGGAGQPGAEALLHSSRFIIADKAGMIREYYGATEPDAVDHVAGVVADLAREN
jgi:cytochrome oxidase Cu insertion factor (SCO1/SenC/PrrC family)